MTKVAIHIETHEGEVLHKLEISKATSAAVRINFYHLDQLPDGTWRIQYNPGMFPDHRLLEAIEVTGVTTPAVKATEGAGLH